MKKLILSILFVISATAALAQPGPGPGPGPAPSPWVVNGSAISYNGCVLVPASVTGGCKGAGTINATAIYQAGFPVLATLADGKIFVGNGSAIGIAQTPSGDLTMTNAGVFTVSANTISNAKLAQAGAATFKGNPTAATADVQDFTLSGLTALASPSTTLDLLPIWDHTAGTIKSVTPAALTTAVGGITALSGDVVATGPGAVTATIQPNVVTYAKFQQVAASSLVGNPTAGLANAQGITLGTTLAFSGTALQTGAHTGDATSAANSFALTLATVNSNVGTFGSATQASQVTVNAKGLVTAAANVTVTPAVGSVTGLGTGVATALGNTAGGAGGFALVGTTPPTGAAGGSLSGTYPNPTLAAINSVGTSIAIGGCTISTNALCTTGTAEFSSTATATRFISTVSTGTAPLTIASTTVVPNLYVARAQLADSASAVAVGNITGLGTGVATALAVNVGSAGAFVTFNGAGGTPSSLVGTNITGTAAGLTAGNVTTNANLTGPITSVGNATSIASQTGTGTTFVVNTGPTISALVVTGSFTATGLVTNAALANPSTTVNGQTCTLGSTCTVTAAAGTLTGATLAAGVTASSLTSVGTLTSLTTSGAITGGTNGGTGGSVVLNGSTSGSGTIRVAAAAGTGTIFQIPATNGTSTQVLQTNGSGVTSWVDAAGGGTVTSVTCNGGTTVITSSGTCASREILSTTRNYYVRTDGSDSNTGLVNDAAGAFLTIQKCVNVAAALDMSIYGTNCNVADGAYNAAVVLKSYVGNGPLNIVGNTGTPANVTITIASNFPFLGQSTLGSYQISGMTLSASTAGYDCILATGGTKISLSTVYFGACGQAAIHATYGAQVLVNSNYTISGGGTIHWYGDTGGMITVAGRTVTLSGSPVFSTAFAFAGNMSLLVVNGNTFSGAAGATTPRYNVSNNATISTGGAGTSYLPGTSAGTGTNPGTTPFGLYN